MDLRSDHVVDCANNSFGALLTQKLSNTATLEYPPSTHVAKGHDYAESWAIMLLWIRILSTVRHICCFRVQLFIACHSLKEEVHLIDTISIPF